MGRGHLRSRKMARPEVTNFVQIMGVTNKSDEVTIGLH